MSHSKFSPSAAHRWFICPGSVFESQSSPEQNSEFAAEGSLAHFLAETCLKLSLSTKEVEEFERGVYPEDMLLNVQKYLDYIAGYRANNDILLVEKLVNYTDYAPEGFGTCDAILIPEEKDTVHIFDFKYGKGVFVGAKKNIQLMIYALAARQSVPECRYADTFHLHIVQPRMSNISRYTISASELQAFGEVVSEKSKFVLENPNKKVPGPVSCKWCPAKQDCTAYFEYVFSGVQTCLEVLDTPATPHDDLEYSVKKRILDMKDEITSYIKQLEKEVLNDILSGVPFEGYKVVEGRKNRKWKADAISVLEELLGEKAYTKKVASVPEVEKLIGSEKIQSLIEKERGGPVLAPVSDRRKEYEFPSKEELFQIIES